MPAPPTASQPGSAAGDGGGKRQRTDAPAEPAASALPPVGDPGLESILAQLSTDVIADLVIAAMAAVVIAVPSDLIDTSWFGRPVAVRPIDYVILAVTAALIGLVLAIRPESASEEVSARRLCGSSEAR